MNNSNSHQLILCDSFLILLQRPTLVDYVCGDMFYFFFLYTINSFSKKQNRFSNLLGVARDRYERGTPVWMTS